MLTQTSAFVAAMIFNLSNATIYQATATYYTPAQGGTAICGREGGYCGAPNDGAQFWQGSICGCGGSDPYCKTGYCYDCWNANLCQS